jgi:hypothetical protein
LVVETGLRVNPPMVCTCSSLQSYPGGSYPGGLTRPP